MDLMKAPIAVEDSLKLDHVLIQQVLEKQLADGSIGYMLDTKKIPEITFGEYRTMAEKYDQKYKNFDVSQLEDEFWKKMNEQKRDWEAYVPRYSVDNNFSLFNPDTQIWNFSKFTGQESEIHDVNIYILLVYL